MNLKFPLISSHSNIHHYRGEDIGLTQLTGLREIHAKIGEPRGRYTLGLSHMCLDAHNWVKHRFRHREAARFKFSHILSVFPRLQIQV